MREKCEKTGLYRCDIRSGVVDSRGKGTPEFQSWNSGCSGRVVIQHEPVTDKKNYTKIPRWYVYFELEEDLVSYLLTFDEIERRSSGEAAAFYAPYIPLTMSGAKGGSAIIQPVISTRYGNITVPMDED
jgi:hypothetical protein